GVPSPALDRRADELIQDAEALLLRRRALQEERQELFDNPGQDEARAKRLEGNARGEKDLKTQEGLLQQRRDRYLSLVENLNSLSHVQVVSSSLVWADGYPADGSSSLCRLLDGLNGHSFLWLQAAGDIQDQSWVGLHYDKDDNGIME